MIFQDKNKKSNIDIDVKLLPEKEKRDYVLRLVSFTLVLIFVIINFFIVYLPRLDLLEEVHSKKGALYRVETKRTHREDLLSDYDQSLYNIKSNKEVSQIENNNLDFVTIIEEIKYLFSDPNHTFIENVKYKDADHSLILTIQFETTEKLAQFQYNAILIEYITNIDRVGPITDIEAHPNSIPRQKTTFQLFIDIDNAPKAGGIYE
ncbi:hypothetical protein [Haloplasma contractile]|uniref:Uncharacterized protein n=1 Tax=Haloplasma contractile SSD-17B TaxID=1033810 RepID=U2E040_9MOLU|nr:hypothetical protein [Haloplasma contractile]ERJ13797.1 hypothetical protein HLPCO_000463 [Haloplasma contractile SSD-17B]